jgi:peptidoglycan/LPS O-acetylase OafA/YrhL
MESGKIEVLDSMRALAAVSVCLFHFICTTTGYITDQAVLGFFRIGQYGVQMFFVISGFVIPWAMYAAGYRFKHLGQFMVKRLARLEPPYLFSIGLALAILIARYYYYGAESNSVRVSASQVFLHFGYLIPFVKDYEWLTVVYWTLAIEFQYYLLMSLIFIPLVYGGIVTRIVLYLSLVIPCFWSPVEFLPRWLPLFLLGIMLFLYKTRVVEKKEFTIVILALLVICFFTYPVASNFYAVLPVVAVLYFPDRRFRVLDSMGKWSYSLYLIHPLLGASLINLLSHHYVETYQKWIVIFAGLVVTFSGAYFTYRYVETPSRRLSASIKYKKDKG